MAGYIGSKAAVTQADGYTKTEADGRYVEGDDTLYVDQTNNRVVISGSDYQLKLDQGSNQPYYIRHASDNSLRMHLNGTGDRLIVDSSGNLLVGTSNTYPADNNVTGHSLTAVGQLQSSVSGYAAFVGNRKTSDGDIAIFKKDGTAVGSISCSNSGSYIYFGSSAESVGLGYGGGFVFPTTGGTSGSDNSKDFGSPSYRWDDIYATNGSIQTSDRNEKQDIEELTDAEQRVAVAAKGLLRKFRWKSAVAKKGEAARTHFGIIAQDLQAAFEAEGLDAGDYAMFISSTWTDEETGEERTRLGVRYSELLAFIIGAL